jgi:AraC-like DNA-binding protein
MAIAAMGNPELLIAKQFDSFEELSALAQGWNTDFRQVAATRLPHFLLQAQVDGVLVSHARFGCHVEQRGATPEKMRTFAVTHTECPEMRWFGHRFGSDALLAFPTHGEIEVFSRPGFSVSTFSIDMDALAEFAERYGGPSPEDVLDPTETVIPIPAQLLKRLRWQLLTVTSMTDSRDGAPNFAAGFQWRLFSILLEVFRSLGDHRPIHQPVPDRPLFENIVDLVNSRAESDLRLVDLCTAGQISERTLNNLFRKEFGLTPKAYVKGQRLFRAHQDLWRASAHWTSVSDIANSWGFWHMGQFAADYRKMFGELPSETLKRSN